MVVNIKLAFAALLLGVLLLPTMSVSAQSNNVQQGRPATQEAEESTVDTSETTEETAAEKKANREARINEYKQQMTEKLAAAKSARITARCKGAQGKITALKNRLSESLTNRTEVYQNIGDKLTTLISRMKAANINTSELEVLHTELQAKAADLGASIKDYIQVLEDLEAMDCAADPTAFNAALEAARAELKAMKEEIVAMKELISTDLKALLKKAREALAAKEAAGGQEEEDTGGTQ